MVRKKSGSHRQGLKDKYKIQRKCREHRKKLNKQAKGNTYKKVKKDPGIPNLWPFKEKLLKQAEITQEREAERKLALRQKRQAAINRARNRPVDVSETKKDEYKSAKETDFTQRRWYFKELKKVIEMADVILEVVDARDPMGCRCTEIERRIQAMSADGSSPKKLVIVINKIDLVPPDVATKWVTHFRREFPTIAFKASTQQQSSNLKQNNSKLNKLDEGVLAQGSSVGAGALMSLLKNYARSLNMKKTITVGCIGFPNVGKSSIVNSLKRSKAAGVSSSAGHTKVLQTIKLDHNISLIDSPGVLFAANESQADLVLRSCLKIDQMQDPVEAVVKLVQKVPKESLMEIYRVADFNLPQQFVSHVAHKRGKLKAGGVPNMAAAAVTILKDWTSGAIPFYTLPPDTSNSKHDAKEIVSGWGAEFDIGAVLGENDKEMASAEPAATNPNFITMQPSAPLAIDLDGDEDINEDEDSEGMEDDEDDDDEDDEDNEDMEDDETEPVQTQIDLKKVKKTTKKKGAAESKAAPSFVPASQQRGKALKKSIKKSKKKARRAGAGMKD